MKGFSLPLFFRVLRPVMLAGAAIYLTILSVFMASGSFTWRPDFLGTHGEPYLVAAFGFWAAMEAIWAVRQKI